MDSYSTPYREDDIWVTLANYCPSLNVIDVIDREKPYEPLLEESDDPAYPSRNPNVCHINSILLLFVMHPQFYLFKDLKSF